MSKLKLVPYSNKFPTLSEWSKLFRYRNAISPRATICSPSIAGKKIYTFEITKKQSTILTNSFLN